MAKISDKLLQEIIDDSNHTDMDTVRTFITNGRIVIYRNMTDYIKDGCSFAFEKNYTLLSNGAVAHYH